MSTASAACPSQPGNLEMISMILLSSEMEMDSHGGLEVTIRQTESKKKNYPTTS